jgi:hypothetical protein
MSRIPNKLTTLAAIAAAGLGGAAIANAATSSSTTPSTTSTTSTQSAPSSGSAQQPQHDPSKGGHQANGKTETLLTGDTAAKVKATALAKLPGATIERVETDADHGSPYEAHVTKADGTEVEVLVDSSFTVTAVNAMGHR